MLATIQGNLFTLHPTEYNLTCWVIFRILIVGVAILVNANDIAKLQRTLLVQLLKGTDETELAECT
jgi:hypothetical protein